MNHKLNAATKKYLITGAVSSACAALLAAAVFKGFIPLHSFVGYLSLSLFAITTLAAIGSLALALVEIRRFNLAKQNTRTQEDNARETEVIKSLAAPRMKISRKRKVNLLYAELASIRDEDEPIKSLWIQGTKKSADVDHLEEGILGILLVLNSLIEETSHIEEIIIDMSLEGLYDKERLAGNLAKLVRVSNLSFLKIGDIVFTNEANIRARNMTRELTTFFEGHAAAELALAAAAEASHSKKLPVSKRSPAEFGLAALPKNVVLKIGAELFNSYQPKAKPANAPDTDGSHEDLVVAAQLAEPTGASADEKIPAEVSELFDAARASIRAKA